ncbi:NifB/NifX family molybdenum-iron cluster-binding protein [Methanococcoides sp. AM1]|uniref:NifB/NifX family molybdenum-iron cluster-binding protein n=1 Tax=Methanococcoides sp. AM1 TaxID=1201011 RepID=UPI001084881A|nr:NifB/NifX family molybdenum-iron cluster-binding protein [Methanococcoides sp. AM1]
MKIAIPSTEKGGLDDDIELHFGKAATYTIYDSETEEVEIIENTSVHVGGKGLPHELLVKSGADVVLCSGVGQKIVDLLNENDIEIFVGADGTVQDAINSWKAGDLYRPKSINLSKDHGFGLTQHSL